MRQKTEKALRRMAEQINADYGLLPGSPGRLSLECLSDGGCIIYHFGAEPVELESKFHAEGYLQGYAAKRYGAVVSNTTMKNPTEDRL